MFEKRKVEGTAYLASYFAGSNDFHGIGALNPRNMVPRRAIDSKSSLPSRHLVMNVTVSLALPRLQVEVSTYIR